MQNILGLLATILVLIAISGVVPIMICGPAAAQAVSSRDVPNSAPPAVTARLGNDEIGERGVTPSFDVDSLTLESDFTVFMHSDCSPELQRQALRKLWSLLPPTPTEETPAF